MPVGDSQAISEAVVDLLDHPIRRDAMRKRAYLLGREMTWARVARRYMEAFERVRDARLRRPRPAFQPTTVEKLPGELPLLKLDHHDHVLMLNLHHIVSDGWSEGILFGELEALYEAYRQGQASPLPELPIQRRADASELAEDPVWALLVPSEVLGQEREELLEAREDRVRAAGGLEGGQALLDLLVCLLEALQPRRAWIPNRAPGVIGPRSHPVFLRASASAEARDMDQFSTRTPFRLST